MARRRKSTAVEIASHSPHIPVVTDWEIGESFPVGKKVLTHGSVFTVRGERSATFRFVRHVRRPDGSEWIDCVGGTKHGTTEVKMSRSFRPERISRVVRS